jgi:peptidoglycan hydrolase-like protein with peptidoglycan-binding domain
MEATRRLFLGSLAASVALAGLTAANGSADGGSQVWQQAGCGGCHTLAAAGSAGTVGPNLDQLRPSAAAVAAQVAGGGGGMPSFGQSLSATQIQAVAAYVAGAAGRGAAPARPAPVQPGSSGLSTAQVRRLQLELARLGFFHGPRTGFYGPLTAAAVRRLQTAAGLAVDGVWGPDTARTLARLSRRLSPKQTAANGAGALPPPAAWVIRLQADLARLGFFAGPDTGVYGPLTTAAVKRFQVAAGITADGRWGPVSQSALVRRLRAHG